MMRAVILVNAYIRAPAMLRQAERIAAELRLRGVRADIVKNGDFPCAVAGEISLGDRPDFVVDLDKDKYLPRMLEKCGVRLFNRAQAVEVCDDKMLTCIALAGGGVRQPDTVPAPVISFSMTAAPMISSPVEASTIFPLMVVSADTAPQQKIAAMKESQKINLIFFRFGGKSSPAIFPIYCPDVYKRLQKRKGNVKLLHGDALREIPRPVHVLALAHCNVVRKELQRYCGKKRVETFNGLRDLYADVGQDDRIAVPEFRCLLLCRDAPSCSPLCSPAARRFP